MKKFNEMFRKESRKLMITGLVVSAVCAFVLFLVVASGIPKAVAILACLVLNAVVIYAMVRLVCKFKEKIQKMAPEGAEVSFMTLPFFVLLPIVSLLMLLAN
ncbi:hypothetical protein FWH09_02180 [Candidatus Saccharibacteria bacterium]|nr:hypothetical protein [Candidatus Saccharibacteria bacterium]